MTNEELKREYVKGWYVLADRYRRLAADYRRQADELERQAMETEKTLLGGSKAHGEPPGQWMEPPAGWKPIVKTPPGTGQLAPEFPNPFARNCPHCQALMVMKVFNGRRFYRCVCCDDEWPIPGA